MARNLPLIFFFFIIIFITATLKVYFKSVLRWSGQKKYETLDAYIDLDDDFEKLEMHKTL